MWYRKTSPWLLKLDDVFMTYFYYVNGHIHSENFCQSFWLIYMLGVHHSSSATLPSRCPFLEHAGTCYSFIVVHAHISLLCRPGCRDKRTGCSWTDMKKKTSMDFQAYYCRRVHPKDLKVYRVSFQSYFPEQIYSLMFHISVSLSAFLPQKLESRGMLCVLSRC